MRVYTEIQGTLILAVDDNPNNLELLTNVLGAYGADVRIATSGEQLFERVNNIIPDLILLDVMMPGIDGFETCRRLKERENTKDIPVLFMTALSDITSESKGFEVGGIDYISKPIELGKALPRINTHLQVQRQKKELIKLNSERNKFLSIIAHDLRNPLLGIQIQEHFIEKYISSICDPELEGYFTELSEATENIIELLDSLLDWVLFQQGVIKYKPERIELTRIIDETISLLKPGANQKNIIIITRTSCSNISVYSDLEMSLVIFRNLLNNAIKFSNSGTKITIECQIVDTDFTEISITDTGLGIPANLQDKLFHIDKYFSRAGTAGEKGTGMGLLLCKDLVEKNGGRIWFRSEENKGSTFSFTLPNEP
ncbi:MAG: hybrid sensor histidine kinase/response regulator [Spirochaetales bacterium]|nr:hybrid sensor histidine kinase/response regulator [Spirochaetales bacterium]